MQIKIEQGTLEKDKKGNDIIPDTHIEIELKHDHHRQGVSFFKGKNIVHKDLASVLLAEDKKLEK